MKQKLIILLLLFATWQVNAQNKQTKAPYIPVLADTIYWWEVWRGEFGNLEPEHRYTTDKQIYNDTLYHDFNGAWYVEDTTKRKIYRKPAPGSGEDWEIFMYDFSLEEGDSLWHRDYIDAYHWYYVDSIRYLFTYAGKRKIWYLHFDYDEEDTEYPVWVEGLGSLAGFERYSMEPRLDWWGWGILNCWYADDELIYKSDFAEQWGCEMEYMDIDNIPESVINLFPNPVRDIAYLKFENPECKEHYITVYNIIGKEIYKEHTNSDRFTIWANKLSNGIFFYVISANNKFIYSEKFIVKH